MSLKPQDLIVSVLYAVHPGERWTFPALSRAAALSLSETHAAVERARRSRFLGPVPDGSGALMPLRENLLEFLNHGVRYVFPATPGPTVRGVPTARSAPALAGRFPESPEAPLVWPWPAGDTRGQSIEPLYRTAPRAALADGRLYTVLALVDAARCGAVRERDLAGRLLEEAILEARS